MAKGKKTGGRVKGTPNKLTSVAKEMMSEWLRKHNEVPSGAIEPLIMSDFAALAPSERVKVSLEFIKIITPKNINIDTNENVLTIEGKLLALSGETAETADDK